MSGISSATAMLIAGGTSSALTAGGKILQGQEQKQAYDYNADITKLNTDNKVEANQDAFTALVGRQATAYAASGVDIASGSPLLTMIATSARGAREGEQIEESGTEQANLQRYYGRIAAFSGTMSGIGAFLQGMSGDLASYAKLTNNPIPTGDPNAPYGPNSD